MMNVNPTMKRIALEVVTECDINSPDWSFLTKSISPNAPPQRIVHLTRESIALIEQIAPKKIVRKRPNCIMVISRKAIPSSREFVIFNTLPSADGSGVNIEYIKADDLAISGLIDKIITSSTLDLSDLPKLKRERLSALIDVMLVCNQPANYRQYLLTRLDELAYIALGGDNDNDVSSSPSLSDDWSELKRLLAEKRILEDRITALIHRLDPLER